MKIRAILENISSQQRGVGQLPADFRPAQTSPQLNGPYPGRNATRGYLVGEDQDMAEGHADQQRKIFKRNGRPVGEVGIDRESSPGVGQYYMKHYASNTDNSGYDSFEDALAELRHVMKQSIYGELREQGVAEGRFDEPLTGWHIVYRKSGNPVHATPSFETKDQAQKYLMTKMFANHQDYKVVHTAGVGVAEGTDFFDRFGLPIMPDDDGKFQDMMRGIKRGTKKQARADRRERDAASRERARAAFGPSPADKLSIRSDKGVSEGFMDTLKGAARELTRDSMQKKIKQAWENTFWPKHIEPALNRIQIDGHPFRRMVMGEPRVIENDRSKNAILKQYTVNIVFPIDPEQWAGDEIRYLEGQLRDIEAGDWNPKVHGLGLVSFDQPMKSFQYTKGRIPDLVIPVRITSLDINRSLVGEQGVAEGGYNPLDDERREQSRMDAERRQFKRDELAAELGGEEQRAQQIMSGTWYIVIDGQVWKRGGQPVTFPGRDAARRAGQTIKNRTPERTVTITTRIPAAENSDLAEAPLDIDLIKRAQGGMSGTNQDPDSERFRDQPYGYRDRAQDRFDPMARLDKGAVNSIERALGIKWPKHRAWQGTVKVDESRDQHYLQMFREAVAAGMTSEDVITTMKRQLGDYLQDVAKAIRKDPDLVDKIPQTGNQIGPAVRTLKTDDGHEIRIHGNEDDGFRISIRNRTIPSRFTSLDEAEMATEMYCARRRQATQLRDDYVDEA